MHRNRDFDLKDPAPWNERALTQDLALKTLFAAAAGEDELIEKAVRVSLLGGWRNDPETILYRQAVALDGLNNPEVLRELYQLTVEAIASKRDLYYFGYRSSSPSLVLHGAIALLQMYLGALRHLREIAEVHAHRFASEGVSALFEMLQRELSEEYLSQVAAQLEGLQFRRGVLISGALGPGNAGCDYVLRQGSTDRRGWLQRLLAGRPAGYTYRVPDRDEVGGRELSDLRDRGIQLVARNLGRAADQIDGFFQSLRAELAFYVGCLNLREQLAALGEPTCFPRPLPIGQRSMRCRELYDPCLALQMKQRLVGNTVDAAGMSAVIVTGANRGGKSSFLRGLGLAQLMLQCGMFVGAEDFESELCAGLITHYKREEDPSLKSGKLDEELARMSECVDHLAPNVMVFFNESFSSTNEREGSEIARQVVLGLVEEGIKVHFVTHLHAFARGLFESKAPWALFLRAERMPDGTRTFRLIEGEPLATSYGRDLYERIFAAGPMSRSV